MLLRCKTYAFTLQVWPFCLASVALLHRKCSSLTFSPPFGRLGGVFSCFFLATLTTLASPLYKGLPSDFPLKMVSVAENFSKFILCTEPRHSYPSYYQGNKGVV